jgi:hypothetical protein
MRTSYAHIRAGCACLDSSAQRYLRTSTSGFTVLRMDTTDTRPGAVLARQRWDRPEHVDRRVERLAAEIAKLPRLTRDQRARLTAAIKAA